MQEIIKKINELKKQKNAIILVHNYQRPEIYEVADFIGDSLGLARKASQTKADTIVFCGVDFMAETAKILNSTKTVLLPALMARCPMAGMVNPQGLKDLQKKYPRAKTVCYVNTTAEIKALSDVCCTSANAVDIVKKIDAEQIIFVPDENLANYVQTQVPDKQIIAWQGYCYVHSRIMAQQLQEAKRMHPGSKIVVHPESPADIINQADHVTSTTGMINYAVNSESNIFIIATEIGMVHRLQRELPDKKFYGVGGTCIQMKKNSLELVLESLEKKQHQIEVSEEIRIKAKKSLDKMLEI